jgi:exoribonuclease R
VLPSRQHIGQRVEQETTSLKDDKSSHGATPPTADSSSSSSLDVVEVSRVIQSMAEHCNEQHRRAKNASMRSQELFFALYFNAYPKVVDALVYKCHENGVMAFVADYMIKMPLRVVDRLGSVSVARYARAGSASGGECVFVFVCVTPVLK